MKKKLLTIAMVLCLVLAMMPLGAEMAFAYGGEPGDIAPTVTLDKRGSEFYTLEFDTRNGWVLDVYGGSDTVVNDITVNGYSEDTGDVLDHVRIANIPDGADVKVTFMGINPAMDSPCLDSKLIKLSYTKTTYNGKAKKPQITIGKQKQADLVKKGLITVKYVNNKKPGIAKVIIKAGPKANGKFKDQTTMYFRITPKKMNLTSLTSEEKGELVFEWAGQKYASGYNILISEAEDFAPEKTYRFTVYESKYTSMAFKEAKSGVKYYVKIRSYTDSDDGCTYGAWGKALSVTAL